MGAASRTRTEMERLRERSRMDRRAQREREGRTHRWQHYEFDPAADGVFEPAVGQARHGRLVPAIHAGPARKRTMARTAYRIDGRDKPGHGGEGRGHLPRISAPRPPPPAAGARP